MQGDMGLVSDMLMGGTEAEGLKYSLDHEEICQQLSEVQPNRWLPEYLLNTRHPHPRHQG